MAKKNTIRPAVKFDSFKSAIKELKAEGAQLTVQELKGWVKVEGPTGCRLYIQKSDDVRQVDLSAFGADMPGPVESDGKNGNVQAHLDLSVGEPAAIEAFKGLLLAMQDVQPVTKSRGGRGATKKPVDLSDLTE